MKKSFIIAASLAAGLGLAQASHADVVIGDFEGGVAETGWGQWISNAVEPFQDITISNEAATSGTYSAKIDLSGWGQSLAYSGGTAGTIADFENNFILEFDVIFPETTESGWAELFDVALNSEHGGFTSITTSSTQVGWAEGGGGAQTINVALDYSTIRQTWIDNGSPGWVELIFAFNDDGNHAVKYVDNVRLTPDHDIRVAGDGWTYVGGSASSGVIIRVRSSFPPIWNPALAAPPPFLPGRCGSGRGFSMFETISIRHLRLWFEDFVLHKQPGPTFASS